MSVIGEPALRKGGEALSEGWGAELPGGWSWALRSAAAGGVLLRDGEPALTSVEP